MGCKKGAQVEQNRAWSKIGELEEGEGAEE